MFTSKHVQFPTVPTRRDHRRAERLSKRVDCMERTEMQQRFSKNHQFQLDGQKPKMPLKKKIQNRLKRYKQELTRYTEACQIHKAALDRRVG